jgi:hypothetical protein
MRKRIQEYKEKHKNAKPIATPIEINKGHKKRKNNEQESICTLIILSLSPPQPIKEIPMVNTIKEILMANDSEHELIKYEQDKDPNYLITNWFLDLGVNAHFCNDRIAFIKYKPICEKHNTAKIAGSN